jgi:hypothetical protein
MMATFFIPRLNVIESDEGFSVEVLAPDGSLRYTEGPRTMEVDSEMLVGPTALVIYSKSIKHWNPPYSQESVDEAAKQRIIDNMQRAFRFRGFEIDVD